MEYKFGQRYYNELGFSWADVGFNEQLQLKVEVLDGGEERWVATTWVNELAEAGRPAIILDDLAF